MDTPNFWKKHCKYIYIYIYIYIYMIKQVERWMYIYMNIYIYIYIYILWLYRHRVNDCYFLSYTIIKPRIGQKRTVTKWHWFCVFTLLTKTYISSIANIEHSLYIYIYHHHHHVVPLAQISLTISRHFSLSFIASCRSSGLHLVSSHSCCM